MEGGIEGSALSPSMQPQTVIIENIAYDMYKIDRPCLVNPAST